MATDTNLSELVINYLTQAQFDAAVSGGTINANEIYLTPDNTTIPTTANSATTGITASTTATKTTLGTASSIYGVQSSTTTASKVTLSGSNSFSASVSNHVLSFSHGAQTVSASDVTVPIKNGSSTSIPNVSVASATVSITDPGHTHGVS